MSNNQNLIPQDIPADDGWGDAADEGVGRMIKGERLKCVEGQWLIGKEGTLLDEETRLVALMTSAAWIRWENRKPVETRLRRPGSPLPERDELGYDDEDDWEFGLSGEKVDPWQNTRLVYFVDPDTAEDFTYSTSSWGGRDAVVALGDQITRMRKVHADAVPIVEFKAVPKKTPYGRKMRPVFRVVGWKTSNPEIGNVEPIGERLIGSDEIERTETKIRNAEIDDEIPF
jgi:hypothetical protein